MDKEESQGSNEIADIAALGEKMDRRVFMQKALGTITAASLMTLCITKELLDRPEPFETTDLFRNIIDDLKQHLEEKSGYQTVETVEIKNSRGTIVMIEVPLPQEEIIDDKDMLSTTYTQALMLRGIPAESIVFLHEKAGLNIIYAEPSDSETELRSIIDRIIKTKDKAQDVSERIKLIERCGSDLALLLDPLTTGSHISLKSTLYLPGDEDVKIAKRIATHYRARDTKSALDVQRGLNEEFINTVREKNMGNICILTQDGRLLREVITKLNTRHPDGQFSTILVRDRLNKNVPLNPME